MAILSAAVSRICRASSANSSVNVNAIAPAVTPATTRQPPRSYASAKIISDNQSLATHGCPSKVCDKWSAQGKEPVCRRWRPTPLETKEWRNREAPEQQSGRRPKERCKKQTGRGNAARARKKTRPPGGTPPQKALSSCPLGARGGRTLFPPAAGLFPKTNIWV